MIQKRIIAVLMLMIMLLSAGCFRRNTGQDTLPETVPVPTTSLISQEDVPDFIMKNHVDLHSKNLVALQLEGVLYLIATMGEQKTGGYAIDFIEYRDRLDHTWDVFLETRIPKPGENVTQALTYPAAFARFHPQMPAFHVRFFIDGEEVENVTVKQISAPVEEIEVTLYYGTEDAYLIREPRPVPISFLTANAAAKTDTLMRELLKGSMAQFGTINVIPEGTEVLNISYNETDKSLTVNLSSQFAELSGSAAEQLAVYSIVNTLTQLDEVDAVTFVLEGSQLEHIDEMVALTYNEQLVKDR